MSVEDPRGWPDFRHELLAILNDPQVRGLARRKAGDPDLAEDALQSTYYAITQVADPAAIRDLRAYFCRSLIREVNHQRAQLGATLVDDFAKLADERQGRSGTSLTVPRPVDETASLHILAEDWLRPFTTQRGDLLSSVPGRSSHPARYRDVIVAAAERALRACMVEKVTDADHNDFLSDAYPGWFAETGCAQNTRDKRLERARADIRALLQSLIDRKDLDP
jgi:DNA-directed RNA polymerase specialized sigma24 family protein